MKMGRLRNSNQLRHPRWRQGRQCTDIQTWPFEGAEQRLSKPLMTLGGLISSLRPVRPSFMPLASPPSKVWDRHLSYAEKPIAIIMGSESDWETMRHAAALLDELKIGFTALIISAHRTPERLVDFAKGAKAAGFKIVIAGAGGAAHLPGMTAAMTLLPVLGVPIQTTALGGEDSLFSIVQMPAGVPVGTLAIGKSGAINAALLAAAILALGDRTLETRLTAWRAAQTDAVARQPSQED